MEVQADDCSCLPGSPGTIPGGAVGPPAKTRSLRTAAVPASRPRASGRTRQEPFAGVSPRSRAFLRRHFHGISTAEWKDWRWQLRHRFSSIRSLSSILALSESERQALTLCRGLPVAVTPYYASLVNPVNASGPLRRCVIPVAAEYARRPGEADDPLAEDAMSPVPGLVHRYPDRALFLVTGRCFVNCRYCTRSRVVADDGMAPDRSRWATALDYIARTPSVRDVLVSGGDPLTMSDSRIEYLLRGLRRIRHVEIVRIGTKAPVVLPHRITPELTKMLRRYHPLWMSIHFTHPDEITPEVTRACGALADAGIPLGSQTVLLKGVNDDAETMKRLVHGLMRIRVRPYDPFQCDPITGSAHFRTPVSKGLEIIERLRGHTSGYAVPQYVIDAPGGGGKILLTPDCVVGRQDGDLLLRNYAGGTYRYPDRPCPAEAEKH